MAEENKPSDKSSRVEPLPQPEPQPQPEPVSQPEPQPANMEVHKHPHHVTHKKKWGEYLSEFLMIFLAVTMGFFAETIREHSVENKRAREFAISMYKDLREDTIQLRIYREYFRIAASNIDTLMRLLAEADVKDISSGKLYWYGLWGGAHRYFVPNDATIQQMKSSGSLRYFKKEIAGDVGRYDRFCRYMHSLDEHQEGVYVEVRKSRAQLFDFRYNNIADNIAQQRLVTGSYARIDSFMKTSPALLTVDKTLFNEYIELVRSRFFRTNISTADSLLKTASVLIMDLKKEYDVDDDD